MYKSIRYWELFEKLRDVRQRVQSGQLRFVATHEAQVIAFLLPVEKVEELELQATETVSIADASFGKWRQYKDSLMNGTIDAVFLTYRTRPCMVLLSAKFKSQLSLPVIGDPNMVVYQP